VEEFVPTTAGEVSEHLRARWQAGGPGVRIIGGGTSAAGSPEDGGSQSRLRLHRLDRVIDYPARDQTITVEAGIRVAELQRLLAAERQRLPIDIPQADRATLGGAIAENVSGPARYGHGTLRDYVIGIRAVDGRGRLFAAGGRVVKNVAGYDLCKLLVGSRGTLAAIVETTLKLRPLPETRRCVWANWTDWSAVEPALVRLLTSATRPMAIELFDQSLGRQLAHEAAAGDCDGAASIGAASQPGAAAVIGEISAFGTLPTEGPCLCLGFEGSDRESAWQCEEATRELRESGAREIVTIDSAGTARLWSVLTELPAALARHGLCEAAVLPSRIVELVRQGAEAGLRVRAHAGNGIVHAVARDGLSDPERCQRLAVFQRAVEQCGGRIGRREGWTPSPATAAAISRAGRSSSAPRADDGAAPAGAAAAGDAAANNDKSGASDAALRALRRRLRATFDPAGLFALDDASDPPGDGGLRGVRLP